MNILVISRIDCAACGYFTAQAINLYTGHHARAVRRKRRDSGYIHYPVDVESPDRHELRSLWVWADVVHVYDTPSALPRDLPPRPTVITYNGSMYRKRRAHFDRRDRANGWVQTATTLDLTGPQVGWLPCARPPLDVYRRERRAGLVVHAPTSRRVKSTEAVIKELGKLRGVRLDVIEGVSWVECLTRKARAHVLVDQFDLGYGCNAVEAWALGIPVVGNARPDILAAMRQVIGYVPFTVTPLDRLAEVVLELTHNPDFYAYELARGKHCYKAHHSLESVARRALGYYKQALEQFASRGQTKGLPGQEGMELLQYRGLNVGIETFHGALTGARYKFAGGDVRWVDRRDAVALLGMRNPRDKPLFERVEAGLE